MRMGRPIASLAITFLRNMNTGLQFSGQSRHMSLNDARNLIGKREIVCWGFNGQPSYCDRPDYPIPAIRWKETTSEVLALREKEKADWNHLTIDEKKALYRASYRQTFAEFKAPDGEWKSVIATNLILVSLALWCWYWFKMFIYAPMPCTFDKECREAQLRRIIDLRMNPVTGVASKWDYEKDEWKK